MPSTPQSAYFLAKLNERKRKSAPLFSELNRCVALARHAQIMSANHKELQALQAKLDHGQCSQDDVRRRARELVNHSGERARLQNELLQQQRRCGGQEVWSLKEAEAYLWTVRKYRVSDSAPHEGQLIFGRNCACCLLFFESPRGDCVWTYTLAFMSPHHAARFEVSLLGGGERVVTCSEVQAGHALDGASGIMLCSLSHGLNDRAKVAIIRDKVLSGANQRLWHIGRSLAARRLGRWVRAWIASRSAAMAESPEADDELGEHTSSSSSVVAATRATRRRRKRAKRERRSRARAAEAVVERARAAVARDRAVRSLQRCWRRRRVQIVLNVAATAIQLAWRSHSLRRTVAAALSAMHLRRDAMNSRLTEDLRAFQSVVGDAVDRLRPLKLEVIETLNDVVHGVVSEATLTLFGSSATPLALPVSDVDLVLSVKRNKRADFDPVVCEAETPERDASDIQRGREHPTPTTLHRSYAAAVMAPSSAARGGSPHHLRFPASLAPIVRTHLDGEGPELLQSPVKSSASDGKGTNAAAACSGESAAWSRDETSWRALVNVINNSSGGNFGGSDGSSVDEDDPLLQIALALQRCDVVRSIRVFGSVSFPILKLVCSPPSSKLSISVDITLWSRNHSGVRAARLANEIATRFPSVFTPVVLSMKQLLREHKLCNTFTGGLSSYALWLFIASFLLHRASNNCKKDRGKGAPPCTTSGEALLEFLDFASGFDFRAFGVRLGLHDVSAFYDRAELEEKQEEMQAPALIDDPMREGHNVASGAFKIAEVGRVFAHAHDQLICAAESNSLSPLRSVLRTNWRQAGRETSAATV